MKLPMAQSSAGVFLRVSMCVKVYRRKGIDRGMMMVWAPHVSEAGTQIFLVRVCNVLVCSRAGSRQHAGSSCIGAHSEWPVSVALQEYSRSFMCMLADENGL